MFPFLNRPDRPRPHADDGYSTEAVAVIATLVILAVGALALISDAVLGWAGSITLG
ncbi:hypothetical protein KGD83_09085 [Nocardiopsis akebiae]|jgi:hypothetical protein|uniref:Preprotein translocase subunit SecE n=1 Tax=Nocardiopsis akebiae TaxID=2831968 RepID=A0ABX8CC54_9ACTN|nr:MULTISPECIES: hypothetical protein [Nocardiopsis]QUX30636.1 hypothetical protein KGD83_09085 [Nocardiopsis akebiae]